MNEEPMKGETTMSMMIVGHRGAMAESPENSLASYARAEELGVGEIELDVRLSKDEQLFLLHDPTMDRVAGADNARDRGQVADLTLAELQAVTLTSGRGVVSLAEMYEATTSGIQLEIKAPETVPYLRDYFREHPDDAARTVLTSFKHDPIREASVLMPEIGRCVIRKTVAGAEKFKGGWQGLVDYTRSTRFACGFEGLEKSFVDALHARGLEFHVWPVRTREDVQRAIDLGADGFTSDDPGQATAWYRELTA
jgi:glycerophosphoryl diester phosphodiesterase